LMILLKLAAEIFGCVASMPIGGIYYPDMNLDGQQEKKLRLKACELIENFTTLYRERVVSAPHRTVGLTGRKCSKPKIISTFLGYELQIRDKRFSCPDKTTALFLNIFAQIGAGEVKVPHDPTRTADLLPVLEKNWYQILDICRNLESGGKKNSALSLHRRLKEKIRETA
jgi:hypothetical protein